MLYSINNTCTVIVFFNSVVVIRVCCVVCVCSAFILIFLMIFLMIIQLMRFVLL